MPPKAKAFVLDSWSIMAYFEDEPAGKAVADLIADAHQQSLPLWMSVVNAGEVWYLIARSTSYAEADRSINELRGLGIQLDHAEWKLAREAAALKASNKMSFADCFAAALAKQKKAHLVTGDQEFKQVQGEVKIIWMNKIKS